MIILREESDWIKKHGVKTHGNGLGFSESEQKWYGWSHRARYGWGIGDTYKKGDSGFEDFGVRGNSFTCKTLDDCKSVAKCFANSVS